MAGRAYRPADRAPDVSIPYPAGMALWPDSYCPGVTTKPWSQSPIQRGWLCGYPRGLGVFRMFGMCLNPLSSGDGFVAVFSGCSASARARVSIPYPAGMALWPRLGSCFCSVQSKWSQSPIQRGWLCGDQGSGTPGGAQEGRLNPLSSGDGFVARHLISPGRFFS